MERHPDLGDPDAQAMANHVLAKHEQEKKQHEHDAKYPEHVKLRAVSNESQKIGNFLNWLLNEKNLTLCVAEPQRREVEYVPTTEGIDSLLGEYFDIDPKKLSEEKDAMVAELHVQAEVG